MSSAAQSSPVPRRVQWMDTVNGVRELLLQATPESLEQAVRRLEEVREQLATAGTDRDKLALTSVEAREALGSLARLRECALRGDQMVSGRLQLLHGADLLYDRQAKPSADQFPSTVRLEG